MTRTRKSLLLTALLVVAAATAGLSGAVASSNETTYQTQNDGVESVSVDSGEVFWQGQFLEFTAGEDNASEVWSVRRVENGQVGSLVTEVLLDANGSAVVPAPAPEGQYVIVDENEQPVVFQNGQAQTVASVSDANFQIAQQSLDVSFGTATVANDDSADARTDLQVNSNRAGYQAYLFSDQLSASQLAEIFSDVEVQNDRAVVTRNVSGDGVLDADFAGVEAGTYNVTVVATDGTAQATASITVSEPVEGTASLSNDTVVEQRGDVVRFNVSFEGTDRATVTVGSRDVGYLSRLTVVDENGDGVATIALDTYRAGLSADSPGLSVVGEDRVAGEVEQVTGPIPGRLEAATYPITVSVGAQDTAVGVIDLNERSTDGMQVWTAPDRARPGSVSELTEVVTQDSDIAYQDWVVVQVQASGLYSYVQNVSDLNNETTGIETNLTRGGEINVPSQQVPLDQARLLVDDENNQLFLLLDSNVLEQGAQYRATFNVTSANPYVEPGQNTSLSANFTVVERTASFDQPVEVPASSEATISGSSSVAPGTELTIEASNTADNPFLKRQTATVSEDGTWEATFDFSDVSPDTNFSVLIDDPEANATGVVVSEGGETTTAEETTPAEEETTPADEEAEETTPAEEEATPADEEEEAEETTPAEEETTPADEEAEETPEEDTTTTTETTVEEAASAPAPGFGPVVAVVGIGLLLAAGVLALRRR